MSLEIVILVAGMGTRMKSSVPKCLHSLGGRPLLAHLLETVHKLPADTVHVVIGSGAAQVKEVFKDEKVNWVLQAEQKGTGHAVLQALPSCASSSELLILNGDVPLVREVTLTHWLELECDLGILSVEMEDPTGYGRIVRSSDGKVIGIVEEQDASQQEKQIREINTGGIKASVSDLQHWIGQISDDNAQGEFLLTDIVSLAVNNKKIVNAYPCTDPGEMQQVNDLTQLAILERILQQRYAHALMQNGVKFMDPGRFDLRGELSAGQDVEIDVNSVFEGQVVLGDGVKIGPNCMIQDCVIGPGTQIRANSVVEGAKIASNCVIGPFARIRPGTELHEEVIIGNFVEVKKSVLGRGTKASHLSYLGDATLGSEVNVGAGTITCNYDGIDKHETIIKDKVFVGSNTALVAPVTLGEQSTIAAGSTITRSVKANALAIGRSRQKDIDNWDGGSSRESE